MDTPSPTNGLIITTSIHWKFPPPPEVSAYNAFTIFCRKDQTEIGVITGHLVDRERALRLGFSEILGMIKTECSHLLRTRIFDERAHLRPTWIDGPRSGSRIWDSRLNDGNFLIVGKIKIGQHDHDDSDSLEEAREGMVFQLLQIARDKDVPWVFAYRGTDSKMTKEEGAAFWRAKGFSRIGRSHILCYATSLDDFSKAISDVEWDVYDSDINYESVYPSTSVEAAGLPVDMDTGSSLDARSVSSFPDAESLPRTTSMQPNGDGNTPLKYPLGHTENESMGTTLVGSSSQAGQLNRDDDDEQYDEQYDADADVDDLEEGVFAMDL